MNATESKQTWRVATGVALPPQDRPIKIVANIVDHDEWASSVEPYEGFAQWSEQAQDWLNEVGLSIRGFYESELVILEWTDGNTGRRFLLREPRYQYPPRVMGPISPTRALKPLPLALPAPDWISNPRHPYNNRVDKISDADLEYRAKQTGQFLDYLLAGEHGRAHLYGDHREGLCEVQSKIETEIVRRWLATRESRRIKDSRRRKKKAGAAA